MLEKSCKKCGCPMFEVRGKTFCVVCAENERAEQAAKKPADGPAPADEHGLSCTCGEVHGDVSCEGGVLADELAMTLLSLCERVRNEEDPDSILALMNSVKVGTEALRILCQL